MNDIVEVPIPIAVPAVPVRKSSRLEIATKFLAWMTACLLSVAVIIALVSVTSERNDLRNLLAQQSQELTCRSAANVLVNQAAAVRDGLIADGLVYIALGDMEALLEITDDLKIANVQVSKAIDAQIQALKDCALGLPIIVPSAADVG